MNDTDHGISKKSMNDRPNRVKGVLCSILMVLNTHILNTNVYIIFEYCNECVWGD